MASHEQREAGKKAKTQESLSACRDVLALPWFASAVADDSLFEEREYHCSTVFLQQPNDVGDRHFAVDEHVANREASLGLMIES